MSTECRTLQDIGKGFVPHKKKASVANTTTASKS